MVASNSADIKMVLYFIEKIDRKKKAKEKYLKIINNF